MDKYDRFFLKMKISFIVFFIAFVMAVRYGIPYIFEKYGMPGEAVVTEFGKGGRAVYEFTVDNKLYKGGVAKGNLQIGDTVVVWYFLQIPWLNRCYKGPN